MSASARLAREIGRLLDLIGRADALAVDGLSGNPVLALDRLREIRAVLGAGPASAERVITHRCAGEVLSDSLDCDAPVYIRCPGVRHSDGTGGDMCGDACSFACGKAGGSEPSFPVVDGCRINPWQPGPLRP